MNGHGEGSIIRRSNGTWRAQITIYGKRRGKTFKTKSEALAWLHKIQTQIRFGHDFEGSKITLDEYLTEWGCACLCLYDLDYQINNVPPGVWFIKVDNPEYYGSFDDGKIIDFVLDLTPGLEGNYCVDRPYLPWEL